MFDVKAAAVLVDVRALLFLQPEEALKSTSVTSKVDFNLTKVW